MKIKLLQIFFKTSCVKKKKATTYLRWEQNLNSHRTFKSAGKKIQSGKSPNICAKIHNTVVSKGGE